MAKVTLITEHLQHFLSDLKDTFWGDLYGRTQAERHLTPAFIDLPDLKS
jgi:hypothetical protein